jgi:prepilin-type N-terminal cleavage/methylation domain-containing protein
MTIHQPEPAERGFTLIELLMATLLLGLVILPVLANMSVSLERLERRQKNLLVAHSLALECLSQPVQEKGIPTHRDTLMADGDHYRIVETKSLLEGEDGHWICILIRQEGRWDTLWTITRHRVPANDTALR